jgi:hypothetical protein
VLDKAHLICQAEFQAPDTNFTEINPHSRPDWKAVKSQENEEESTHQTIILESLKISRRR